jgi:hypothetical protein
LNAGNYPSNEYVADFDQQTGRLAHLEYTIREKMPRYVKFRADFNAYQQFDGTWVPTQINFSLTEPLVDVALHIWKISGVHFNTGVTENFFARDKAFASGESRL